LLIASFANGNNKNKMKSSFITLIILVLAFAACTDNQNFSSDSNAKLSFSTDTVQFDTVFSTIGSTTLQFRFYNTNKNAVKTSISLAGGSSSNYRLNIDGESTQGITDYEILGNDSAFVFVEVTVDPQNTNSPLVVEDSIMFYTNGNTQNVKLIAYGQDVHLYNDSVIDTRTWINDKPYLIYNSILVDSNETLTIQAGCQIHFHNESALWVLGTLKVNGTAEEPVNFKGDRLEEWYQIAPGQWYGMYRNDSLEYLTGGIHLWQGSTNNMIDHAIIENGVKGIQVDLVGQSQNPTLILSNSVIKNMSSIGLLAQSSAVLVYNSVIANCGYYSVVLSYGGNYEFYHSTIANYYTFDSRTTEALALNNYYVVNDEATVFPMNATFGNCIIYGSLENEFVVDQYQTDQVEFNYLFDHCMLKLNSAYDISDTSHFKSIIHNTDSLPKFMDTYESDFRLDTLSAAKDKGISTYSNYFPIDLDGNNRNADVAPDLGAYERIESK
jgi:hypothetical protein